EPEWGQVGGIEAPVLWAFKLDGAVATVNVGEWATAPRLLLASHAQAGECREVMARRTETMAQRAGLVT
ncbi:MAG TPA: hypothetical protein VK403_06970, partial [Allosphingosinicella sp.]|nr:hypothetical protein [Allosphingosinicella sp.]